MKPHQLLYPRQVVIVTTLNENRTVNAAPIAWQSPASFDPTIVTIAVAPTRHTYKNIKREKEFVVNIPSIELKERMLKTAKRYPKNVDELERSGLTKIRSETIKTPRIKECIGWLECKLLWSKRVGDHSVFAGKVTESEIKDFSPEKIVLQWRGREFTHPI